jgi:hypothetical protein
MTRLTEVRSGVGSNDGNIDERAELIISVPRLAIYDYIKMRMIYGKYQAHIENGAVNFLTRRLNALVSEAMQVWEVVDPVKKEKGEKGEGNNEDEEDDEDEGFQGDKIDKKMREEMADAEHLRHLYDEIMETVSMRLSEEHELRRLAKDLYSTWKELKRERTAQWFTCTPARLSARAVDARGGIDADGGNQSGSGVSTGLKGRLLSKKEEGNWR